MPLTTDCPSEEDEDQQFPPPSQPLCVECCRRRKEIIFRRIEDLRRLVRDVVDEVDDLTVNVAVGVHAN